MLSSRSTPRALVRSVGAGVAVVLLASTITAVAYGASPSAQAQVLDRLPALMAFVEAERGLTFRRPVRLEVQAGDDFLRSLAEDPYGDVEQPPQPDLDPGATLQALQLIGPEVDVDEVVGDALDAGVSGFYDGVRERLVVRASDADAYVETVLVHELVHALQDQHFGIDRPTLFDDTEQTLGFSALLEGDAGRVEQAWRDAQPPEVRDEIAAEELRRFGAGDAAGLEDPIEGTLAFPYVAGLVLVEGLLEQGGQPRLDAAFSTPPQSTEQVLHPELVGEPGPVSLPAPGGAGRRVDRGVLGELGVAQLLGEDAREGGPQVGWEGDSYATYNDGDELCAYALVLMDSVGSRDDLITALTDTGYSATPAGATALLLTACV